MSAARAGWGWPMRRAGSRLARCASWNRRQGQLPAAYLPAAASPPPAAPQVLRRRFWRFWRVWLWGAAGGGGDAQGAQRRCGAGGDAQGPLPGQPLQGAVLLERQRQGRRERGAVGEREARARALWATSLHAVCLLAGRFAELCDVLPPALRRCMPHHRTRGRRRPARRWCVTRMWSSLRPARASATASRRW